MLYKNEILAEILEEWAYRVDNGMPNPNDREHIWILSEVLSDLGLVEIKDELIGNLLEAQPDKKFKNPVLNKVVKYKDKQGNEKEGVVGNLLRNPKDSPGRIAAEKILPAEGTPQRDELNKELGGEGQPNKGIEKEKQQIISQMLMAKDSGAPTQAPPQGAKREFTCETLD